MPNKKYKGTAKLSPVSPVSSGFPEFDSPTVSTPNLAKSHTAVFLKKAMSKSATPKKKLKRLGEEQSKSASSEPRLKRVNFALTRNMSQVQNQYVNCTLYIMMDVPHLLYWKVVIPSDLVLYAKLVKKNY